MNPCDRLCTLDKRSPVFLLYVYHPLGWRDYDIYQHHTN